MNLHVPTAVVKIGVVPMEQDLEITKEQDGEIRITGGIESSLLEILSKYVGFTYQLSLPVDGEWGTEVGNGSWTGIIGMVIKGEIDLGLGYLSMTEERYRAVNFSTPYSISDKTFVTNQPKRLPLMTTFIHPFSKDLWISCLILLIICSFVVSRVKSISFFDSLVQIFGTFCKQPANILVKSKRLRLLAGCWGIFIMIITLTYCAVLPSFLTISLKEKPVKSIHDLYEAVKKGQMKCLSAKGSSTVGFLLRSSHHEVRYIGEKIKQNQWFYDLSSGSMAQHLVKNAALIGIRMWFHSPDFGTPIISPESFGLFNVAIAVKDGFCCTSRLNVIILRILSAGLLDKFISDQFFSTALSLLSSTKENPDDGNPHRLTFEDMYGVFRLLLFGYAAAFLCFFAEVIFKFSVKRGKKM